jgi:phage head maturation protease
MQLKGLFEGVTEKKTVGGQTIFKGVATSLALDRHKEVVVPKGADLSNFMESPVLLSQHEHREAPIGMITSIEPGEEDIKFEFCFDEQDPDAVVLMNKVKNGFMRTFSIGFLPTKWVEQDALVDETGKMLESVELDVGDESKYKLDLSRYKATPRRVYTQWEMLEISLVSVPANPEAHVRMMAKELMENFEDADPAVKSFVEEEVNEKMSSLEAILKEFEKELEDYHINGAVASHSTKMVEGAWDGSMARARLAKWASSDSSGEKETMSWGKYARGFGWFDSGKKDAFGSYKLPHHDIRSGEFVGVRSGVTAAMAALLGARGGADIGGDGSAVHSHLSRHYRDMDMDPPEYGKSYTEDELVKINEGTWTKPMDEMEVAAVETPEAEVTPAPVSDDRISKLIEQIEQFKEMLETRAIGFNIKFETILESVSEISRALATKSAAPAAPAEPEAEEEVVVPEEESVVTSLKDVLSHYSTEAGAGN